MNGFFKALLTCVVLSALVTIIVCIYSPVKRAKEIAGKVEEVSEALKTVEALRRSNEELEEELKIMSENFQKSQLELKGANLKVTELAEKNILLEKLSNERIRKFWAMYDADFQ